jgi:hypothetical protein
MPIFGILSFLAIIMYLFYKTKFFRSKLAMEKRWYSAKSNMALGVFVLFYGLNQIIVWGTTASIVIGIIFIALGGFFTIYGYKAYRHYMPLALEEAEKKND